jgi:phospholipid/cholesterol/gamma-HCH transport system ATP-binding protein
VTAPSETLVEVSGLEYAYGEHKVLKGLSLKVPRGKVVAILGPSGCGKTTLLQLIGGQVRPDSGEVRIEGKAVHQLDTGALYALRRRMGVMFQTSGLFSDLSVFENIAFPMREHTQLSDDMIRLLVLMKLEAVGLRNAHRLMPNELSGGMQRRVALARAIALDPMLAMYDEPFAGLDPISLNQVAVLIRSLNDALGTTSIVVSYDISASLKLADHVYVMSDGALVGQGTPQEMMSSEDPFLKQFFHALPDGPISFHFPAKPYAEDIGFPGAVG